MKHPPSYPAPIGASAPAYGEGGMAVVDRLRTWLITLAIRRKIPREGSLRMLDIGCGHYAPHLIANQDRLVEGWGIDLTIDQSCEDRQKFHFLLGQVEECLPRTPDSHFDVVLLISVLEHLWDPMEALRQCYRTLRPGGCLLINVPTWAAKPVLETSAFRLGTSTASSIDDHKMYYSKRELWPLLVRAGFRPSNVELNYQFFGMTLFATARKGGAPI
ncbi:MAG TPA: class I SAM-dependent methyltransferase [Bryobacteraceae bacterium]|nr:class I SAM-dependent methyltransferase [Bryobacteraceae bacterium]